jgi:23S rRNA (adenine2030-N6)-methyltransferase
MNYRHAFHAGNFADCFKHALLVALVDCMTRKPAPFLVLDTHAGAGRYDLTSEPARRTGEADAGIRRLVRSPTPALGRYLQLEESVGLYAGSPLLIRSLLRPGDRLTCCELHSEEALSLRREFRDDKRVTVHERSGWEAMGSLLPPKERRGLVFIDPPFENRDEFPRLAESLSMGHRRFGHGVFAAWYPIKQLAAVRGFMTTMQDLAIRDVVAVELHLREPLDPSRLNGCGLLVVNPPYRFEDHAGQIAKAVLDALGTGESGSRTDLIRIADE